MSKNTKTATITDNTNAVRAAVNAPAPADEYIDAGFAKEALKRSKAIKTELSKINSSFEKIAFNLHWFYTNNGYRQLGYNNVYEFANKEYGIARGTTNNFIQVVQRFAERDADGNVLDHIRSELKDFQSSKLIAMLGLKDEELNAVSSDMSVREIKAKVKEIKNCSTDADSTGNDGIEDSESDDDAVISTVQEIYRQALASFRSLEDYNSYLDGMTDVIEKALKSKAFKTGNCIVEISLVEN